MYGIAAILFMELKLVTGVSGKVVPLSLVLSVISDNLDVSRVLPIVVSLNVVFKAVSKDVVSGSVEVSNVSSELGDNSISEVSIKVVLSTVTIDSNVLSSTADELVSSSIVTELIFVSVLPYVVYAKGVFEVVLLYAVSDAVDSSTKVLATDICVATKVVLSTIFSKVL